MISARLKGWEPGVRVISLIELVRAHTATGSLSEAKALVETLLSGGVITLTFDDETSRDAFCTSAREMGAIVDQEREPGRLGKPTRTRRDRPAGDLEVGRRQHRHSPELDPQSRGDPWELVHPLAGEELTRLK